MATQQETPRSGFMGPSCVDATHREERDVELVQHHAKDRLDVRDPVEVRARWLARRPGCAAQLEDAWTGGMCEYEQPVLLRWRTCKSNWQHRVANRCG